MAIKLYWEQARVYFFAQASYFPERLIESVVSLDELRGHFPDGFGDYLKVEPINGKLVKITNVNNTKFLIEFIEYLRDFYFGWLSTGKKSKPEVYSNLLFRLFQTVKSKYDQYGETPIIDLTDIWQNQNDRTVGFTPFWELIFSENQVGGQIEVINIGYEGDYLDGTNHTMPLPFAEINIRPGTLLRQLIEPPKPKKAVDPTNNARLDFRNCELYVVRNDQEVRVAKLQKDGRYYKFIKYLLDNTDKDVLLDDIKDEVEGLRTVQDLTELVRHSGFNKDLKRIFFKVMKSDRIHCFSAVTMTSAQFEALKNRK